MDQINIAWFVYSQDSVDQIFSNTTIARRTVRPTGKAESNVDIPRISYTTFPPLLCHRTTPRHHGVIMVYVHKLRALWRRVKLGWLGIGVMTELCNHNNINNNTERINNFVERSMRTVCNPYNKMKALASAFQCSMIYLHDGVAMALRANVMHIAFECAIGTFIFYDLYGAVPRLAFCCSFKFILLMKRNIIYRSCNEYKIIKTKFF